MVGATRESANEDGLTTRVFERWVPVDEYGS